MTWPRQSRETVFTTCSLLSKISAYASRTSLAFFIMVLARVSKPDTPFTVDAFLCSVFPGITRSEIEVFKHKDSRGLMPWIQLATRHGCLARPLNGPLASKHVHEGRGIWVLVQTADNQRLFVNIDHAVIRRVVKPALHTHTAASRQYDACIGNSVALKKLASSTTGLKKAVLVLDDRENSKWSIVQYGVEEGGGV